MDDIIYELSLNENEINFKDLEKKIYEFVCREACEMIVNVLQTLDDKLMKEIKKHIEIKVLRKLR